MTLGANNINGQGETAKIDLTVIQGRSNTTTTTSSQPQSQPTPSQCLIATAAFGSELSPQVRYLRDFRDHYILSTASGSAFMNTFNSVYYSFSPQVAEYERGQPWLQTLVKIAIYPLFGILMSAERAYSTVGGEIGSIMAGFIAGSLIGVVYLWPVGLAVGNRVANRLLVILVVASSALLAVTLIALPTILPFSTALFVVVVSGVSAIGVTKAIRYFSALQVDRTCVIQQRPVWIDSVFNHFSKDSQADIEILIFHCLCRYSNKAVKVQKFQSSQIRRSNKKEKSSGSCCSLTNS